jgi:ubiquinone/menaquinone biosynthesis C-methylase UbiE
MIPPDSQGAASDSAAIRLRDTQEAFDSVAADYDGPRGNNELIQDMRRELWRWIARAFAPGSRLLDLGCGTGLDAVHLAHLGFDVTATDWSPRMVERTQERARLANLTERVRAVAVGAHELQHLTAEESSFDGAYSDLGALNCVPDLTRVAHQCARLLKSRGTLVFTVIGRVCPWEMGYYLVRGNWGRVRVRFERDVVAVGMNQRRVWTRYYGPREFYRSFERDFALLDHRALGLFVPPPYLPWMRERHRRAYEWLWRVERHAAGWPLLRAMGDHFLIIMQKRR